MHNYTKSTARNSVVPQTQPIPGKECRMMENNAGGYVFSVGKWKQLERWLILGSAAGTYYVNAQKLTEDNAQVVRECIAEDPGRTLKTVVGISKANRAPKRDPAIYALALMYTYAHPQAKADIAAAVPEICRTGTHMFALAQYIDDLRSWGRSVRRGFANWYNTRTSEHLEYQVIKYKSRTVEGTNNPWTHRDILRMAHVAPASDGHAAIFKYLTDPKAPCKGLHLVSAVARLVELAGDGHTSLTKKTVSQCIDIITKYRIPHDAWPTQLKNRPEVWEAALPELPTIALVRNLGKITSTGLLADMVCARTVADKLAESPIRDSEIHPYNVLTAYKTYSSGHGFRGALTWAPNAAVTDALQAAYYYAFKNVIPANKRTMLAIDVSGSMDTLLMDSNIKAYEAAVALALVTANVEPYTELLRFSNTLIPAGFTAKTKLDDALAKAGDCEFGRTDCALPIMYALKNKIKVDTFIIYTDNESWAGPIHVNQALKQYRDKYGPARLIAVGLAATAYTVNDPQDPLGLDVAGFDSATPDVISAFSRGDL